MNNLILIFLGGGAGSLMRFGISELVRRNFQFIFPVATLCSNLLSCAVLAIMVGFFREKMASAPPVQLLVITGFCGGFSTFSTFSFETVNLLREGQFGIAAANIIISMAVCFGIVFLLAKQP